ncbi:hypothetical protein KC19_2G103800 [Ceratodon purpureus]|uniref:Uncharacterized protein n=1 Tax=Ceratodon purpureus TaxID=3225 RepID=A0A8T0IU41_CERPU|nr:hypothetical protein KC19_2G103800 [Ceratodon purpureus]
MGSMSSPDLQQTPNVNITYSNCNSCAITIDSNITHVTDVDKLELESCTRRSRELELALKDQEDLNGSQLTDKEVADVERRVEATELAHRLTPSPTITITDISGTTKSVALSVLPHSYKHIRNLLWIEHHPVYRTALAEWRRQVTLFASRVERKIQRSGALKNEIYNMLGFYSVFQGVLLTGTSQSNYLHCPNVGLPIALSFFASLCTLVHIWRKFKVISGLQKTISSEEVSLKEAKSRILALEEKGEAFRFSDFLEDKERKSSFPPKFHLCGLKSRYLVPLAISLFSVVFAMSHWLILCHPGDMLGQ